MLTIYPPPPHPFSFFSFSFYFFSFTFQKKSENFGGWGLNPLNHPLNTPLCITVVYPKKIRGWQEYTLVILPGNKNSLRELGHFCHVGAFLIFFVYYAIMGIMRGLFLHVGGGVFLSLVGTLLGLPPPPYKHFCDRPCGEEFRVPKIIKIYLLILKCRIIGLNIFLIFKF